MRFKKAASLVTSLFLLATFTGGCSHKSGWLAACGTKIVKSQHERKAFEKELAKWLLRNGFAATSDPGGDQSWAGGHFAGETVTWYRGNYHNSPPFLLRVQTVPRKDVGGEFTEFHFYHAWNVCGSSQYVTEMKALSDAFTAEFTAWLSECP